MQPPIMPGNPNDPNGMPNQVPYNPLYETHVNPQYGYAPPPPPKKRHTTRNVLLSVLGAFVGLCVLGIIISAATGNHTAKPASNTAQILPSSTAQHIKPGQVDPGAGTATGTIITVSPAAPTTKAAAPATTKAAPAPTQAAPPPMTASQRQAVGSAKDYLNVSHFSRKGLIEQLQFEGFSADDAAYGADHSGADWMAQAVGAAQDYLKVSHFSHSGMVQQLEFEGFTPAEAEHGASAVGL